MNDNWTDVRDDLPKFKDYGSTERVIVSVHDLDEPAEDAQQYEWDMYVPYFTAVAYMTKLSTGCAVWLYDNDTLVEEFDCVVTHWQPMPEPKIIE